MDIGKYNGSIYSRAIQWFKDLNGDGETKLYLLDGNRISIVDLEVNLLYE